MICGKHTVKQWRNREYEFLGNFILYYNIIRKFWVWYACWAYINEKRLQ